MLLERHFVARHKGMGKMWQDYGDRLLAERQRRLDARRTVSGP